MTARRVNEVMPYIKRLAPSTIAYLQVPLTPARAARLADLTLRTGIDPQTLVLDLLDDCIFDMTTQCRDVAAKASTAADVSSARADIPSIGRQS